jgi:hypothetical protein
MFKSVRIQNFRQFRDLKLDNLTQINLITGKNNTGKTSLLEALFLLVTPTNPGSVLVITNLRGVAGVPLDGAYAWGFVFRDGLTHTPIILDADRADGAHEGLSVSISEDLEAPVSREHGANGAGRNPTLSTSEHAVPSLTFEYTLVSDGVTRTGTSSTLISDERRLTRPATGFDQRRFYFLAQGPADAEADAERFSRLVELRRKREVVEALRVIEPRLVDLEVLALRPATVTADLGAGPPVPVGYLGRGFERFLTLVLAILSSQGGTVMIDEIEDGLHYSVLPDVWRVVIESALKHSVQIFATTHSWECLEAAVKGSEGHEGSLAFYRLEREAGEIEVVEGSDSRLRSAVAVGYEIR